MVEELRRLWKENQGTIRLHTSASAYDDSTILLVKQKVWPRGPIYLHDSQSARFPLNDLDNIQRFLVEILDSPLRQETGALPRYDRKEYLKAMGVKSVREAVKKYRSVSIKVVDEILVVTASKRDYIANAWMHKAAELRENRWRHELLGARTVLDALQLSA